MNNASPIDHLLAFAIVFGCGVLACKGITAFGKHMRKQGAKQQQADSAPCH